MTSLKYRSQNKSEEIKSLINNDKASENSEDEMEPFPTILCGEMPLKNKKNFDLFGNYLKNMNSKWRNIIIRGIFGILMISGFSFMAYFGPLGIAIFTLGIQVKCFHEIVSIGCIVFQSHHIPWIRTISWYFLIIYTYYLYGDSLIEKYYLNFIRHGFLTILVTSHKFIFFSLYLIGFIGFVLSLKKTYYLKQFTLFGYIHLAFILTVTQSNLSLENILEGSIWFLQPGFSIICNDVMAYVFGFFFGKTKLIKLSPKKTWEGFIGGAFSTIIFSFILSSVLCKYKFLVCPLEYNHSIKSLTLDCEPSYLFKLTSYDLPRPILYFFPNAKISIYPFQIHSFFWSIFASIVSPFGGFFASGFKRTFKIKDFADTIPGHGGVMDRFDCQVILSSFVNVYRNTFIRTSWPDKLFNQFLVYNHQEQLEFMRLVQNYLSNVTIHQ